MCRYGNYTNNIIYIFNICWFMYPLCWSTTLQGYTDNFFWTFIYCSRCIKFLVCNYKFNKIISLTPSSINQWFVKI